tara:strand:- start:10 stop:210 length:201 start_codon:yes stop_codon:yes gene_type:complete
MDTNELLNMMSSDETSSSEVHDAIKTLLYQKSAEKVDQITPTVAASQFGEVEEPTDAVESEPQEEE